MARNRLNHVIGSVTSGGLIIPAFQSEIHQFMVPGQNRSLTPFGRVDI
jgi:hypothetical protein